jgi:hypothetical protein
MTTNAGSSFEASSKFATGLVGTLGVQIVDNVGGTTLARTSEGIIEHPDGSGIYHVTLTAPDTGQYTVVWDDDAGTWGSESLTVLPAGAVSFPEIVGPAFATVAELAGILKVDPVAREFDLATALITAYGEILSEIDRPDDAEELTDWQYAIAREVNLRRAVEIWHERPLGFNIIGVDSEAPLRLGANQWERHARMLVPLKMRWGLA